VENILDASQSPADDNDEPSGLPGSSSIPVDTTNSDLAAEKATALRLLYSMFGEADEDWGGAESVDSDMEREAPMRMDVPVRMTLPTLKSFPLPKGHPTSRLLFNDRSHRLPLVLPLHRETPIPCSHQQQLSSKTCLHLVKKKASP